LHVRNLHRRSNHLLDQSMSPEPRPPVLLIHGAADPVVPVAALHAAKTELEHLGIDVTTHISLGVGHSVDPVGLRMGGEFVAQALTG
jgi:phospholipase/carboxylesterase